MKPPSPRRCRSQIAVPPLRMAQTDLGYLQSHLAKVGDVSLQASVALVGRQPVKSIGDKSSSPTCAQRYEPPGESPNPEGGQVRAHPPAYHTKDTSRRLWSEPTLSARDLSNQEARAW